MLLSEFFELKCGYVILDLTVLIGCNGFFDVSDLFLDGVEQFGVDCDWKDCVDFVERFQLFLELFKWELLLLSDPIYDVQHDEGHVVVVVFHLIPDFGR